MLPPRYAPIGPPRAARFDRATRTSRRPIFVDPLTTLDPGEAPDGALAGRTFVFIILGHVTKVLLIEQAGGLIARGLWLGNQGGNPGFLTGHDLFALEVAAICDDGQVFLPNDFAGLRSHCVE